MHQTEKHYIHELDGLGRRMPITFCIFTVSSLALMGVPGLAGFVSKWNLATAAAQSNNKLGYIGIGALLISALLTAIYMMSIVMRAFEPGNDFNDEKISQYKDPNILMILPLVIFTIVVIIFGLHSQPFVEYFRQIAGL